MAAAKSDAIAETAAPVSRRWPTRRFAAGGDDRRPGSSLAAAALVSVRYWRQSAVPPPAVIRSLAGIAP